MKRLIGLLFGFALVCGLVAIPTLWFNVGSAGDAAGDETTIRTYDADFTVDADGDLTVVERLSVDFPYSGKHGIFRFWDTLDPSAPHARRIPRDIQVTLDGRPERFEVSEDGRGRYRVAKIGRAEATISPGLHVYTISFRVDGVLEPGTDGARTQLYWNLIPGGWAQRIDRAVLDVDLPAAPGPVQCAVGSGASGGCRAETTGDSLRIEATDLPPRTPVTVKVGLPIETPPAGDTRLWTGRWDPVFNNLPLSLLSLLLALGAALLGLRATRSAHEETPAFPLMYAPPEGIGPAQAAYLFNESPDREDFVATLLYAAEKGAVRVDRHDDQWSITDLQGPAGWEHLDVTTNRIAALLPGRGGTFTTSRSDVAAGQKLKAELAEFESSTRTWARQAGLMETSGLGGAGGFLVIAAWVVTAAVALFNPLDASILALVPGAFAVCATPLVRTGSGTRRTAAGRELWSRIGGFHRVLSTPPSVQRFNFSGRQELYTAYVPWAVALGCAKEWADKYRTEVGAEPPTPSNFAGGYVGAHAGNYTDQMVSDFSSTVDSAISAYQATQTSSSSSSGVGGGFSGGGGGGGGGGGSW